MGYPGPNHADHRMVQISAALNNSAYRHIEDPNP